MGWANQNPYSRSSGWRRAVGATIVSLAVVGVFAAGVAVGASRSSGASAASLTSYLKIGDRGAPRRVEDAVRFEQFWQVWDYIKGQSFFADKVSDLDMFHGAEAGIVASLGDPYSVFFPPKDAKEFSQELSGKFQGIGAEIAIKDSKLTVVAPLPGSPAEKAGLQTNDVIAEIDGIDTTGIALDVAISRIRGNKGTVVTLKILRGSDARTVPIARDNIVVPDTKLTFEGSTAILKLYHFNEGVEAEFNQAALEIIKHRSTSLILDLRGNPGGFLDAAVAVTGAWLSDGDPVVYEQRANGDSTPYNAAKGAHLLKGMRTVVLVNEGSASASEIVAGALQDYGKATLVGETTFGKGSVQTVWQLDDGSAVKLTIASWLTPKKRQINEKGVAPDFTVAAGKDADQDLQMAKAKELLAR